MKHILQKIANRLNPNQDFSGSRDYWENRYKEGGTSGAGSYNRLAEFKAEVLNQFVLENDIKNVMEFGCGDGNQLSLASYPNYIGFDVSRKAIELCKEKFKADKSKSFFLYDSTAFVDNHKIFQVDLSMSLDVIYHLVEDVVFENYMKHLFDSALKFVIIYSSNFDDNQRSHEKDRNFSTWIDQKIKGWELQEIIKNKFPEDPSNSEETSKADFFIYKRTV